MQTRSSSKLARDQTSNPTSFANPTPKGRIRRSSKQKVENSHFEERLTPVDTMTDNRTMAQMLRAPIEGCAEAIIVPPILAEQFELKHSLINMMTSEQFFGLEKDNPHDHVRWLKKYQEKDKIGSKPDKNRKQRGCATWDGGNITWGGRARVLGTVPVCVGVQEKAYGGEGVLAGRVVK
nr:hypothetical protein [Tanacetum cinerariifolium]